MQYNGMLFSAEKKWANKPQKDREILNEYY